MNPGTLIRGAVLAPVLVSLAGSAGAQQIYRWVDAHGKVHYTAEKPPPGARGAATVESRISAVGGNGAPADRAAARAAAEQRISQLLKASGY